MSELQSVFTALAAIDADIWRTADQLEAKARQYALMAQHAAAQAAREEGAGSAALRRAATAFEAASNYCSHAAGALVAAGREGQAFVERTVGSGGSSGLPGSSGAQDSADAGGRTAASQLAPFWASHAAEYVTPEPTDWTPVPERLDAYSAPSSFAAWVNDGGNDKPGRDVNCADCARAVELSWRGSPQVSAARAPRQGGESLDRIEEGLGRPMLRSSFSEVGDRLTALGHGSSAYVVVTWHGGAGHAFNAVNFQGTVFFVDAQPTGGAVDVWPPKRSSPGYGFDESDVMDVFVSFRGA